MEDRFDSDRQRQEDFAQQAQEVEVRTEPVYLSESEREAIAVLAAHTVEPGTRCPTCHRRVNKKRQETSPTDTGVVRIVGPADRVNAVNEALETLQEFTGADAASYPRLELAEKMIALAAQQREELRAHFNGD